MRPLIRTNFRYHNVFEKPIVSPMIFLALREEIISIKEQLNPLPECTAFGHLKFSETLKGHFDEFSALSDKKSAKAYYPSLLCMEFFESRMLFIQVVVAHEFFWLNDTDKPSTS